MFRCFRKQKKNRNNLAVLDNQEQPSFEELFNRHLHAQEDYINGLISNYVESHLDQHMSDLNERMQVLLRDLSQAVQADVMKYIRTQICEITDKYNSEIRRWQENYIDLEVKSQQMLKELHQRDDERRSNISMQALEEFLRQRKRDAPFAPTQSSSDSTESSGQVANMQAVQNLINNTTHQMYQNLSFDILHSLNASLEQIRIDLFGHKIRIFMDPDHEGHVPINIMQKFDLDDKTKAQASSSVAANSEQVDKTTSGDDNGIAGLLLELDQ